MICTERFWSDPMKRVIQFAVFCSFLVLAACGHENAARLNQFDILEKSANQRPLTYAHQELALPQTFISYPNFGSHPFHHLINYLVKSDTTAMYCIGQKTLRIRYEVLWATPNVLSLAQTVWLDCPMSDGKRKLSIYHLYTLQKKNVYKLDLEGSPTLLQEIQMALKKRKSPYCSPPKIEEVFPQIRKGCVEVTPHYASTLCDSTFRRKGIDRKDLRLIRNRVFLHLN
ncbi:MAG: hypothetical protein RLZZ301_1652 [Bacteroidota bacterium]